LPGSERKKELVEALSLEIRNYQNRTDAFDEFAADFLGLNRTDIRCMDIVQQYRRITAGQLADEARLTTGAITTVLDRMERAGYLRRVRDTADRRKVLVELTPKAFEVAGEIWGPIGEEATAQLTKDYTEEQLIFLIEFLRGGRDFLDRHTARIRESGVAAHKRS
jgi:DNA-binding MarR family transcriptional regulator